LCDLILIQYYHLAKPEASYRNGDLKQLNDLSEYLYLENVKVAQIAVEGPIN